MEIRYPTHSPDIFLPEQTRNASSGPLQCLINAVKAVWNALVGVIQSIFSCCVNTEEEELGVALPNEDEFGNVSSSEEEDSDSEAVNARNIPLMRVETAEEKQQLMFAYQDWLRSEDFAAGNPQLLQNLTRAMFCNTGSASASIFALITHQLRQSYPDEYTFFHITVLSPDQHTRLENGLALAYKTGSIQPLRAVLDS